MKDVKNVTVNIYEYYKEISDDKCTSVISQTNNPFYEQTIEWNDQILTYYKKQGGKWTEKKVNKPTKNVKDVVDYVEAVNYNRKIRKIKKDDDNTSDFYRTSIRGTSFNDQSSRSHMFIDFNFELEGNNKKISIIDMAGAEKVQVIQDDYFTSSNYYDINFDIDKPLETLMNEFKKGPDNIGQTIGWNKLKTMIDNLLNGLKPIKADPTKKSYSIKIKSWSKLFLDINTFKTDDNNVPIVPSNGVMTDDQTDFLQNYNKFQYTILISHLYKLYYALLKFNYDKKDKYGKLSTFADDKSGKFSKYADDKIPYYNKDNWDFKKGTYKVLNDKLKTIEYKLLKSSDTTKLVGIIDKEKDNIDFRKLHILFLKKGHSPESIKKLQRYANPNKFLAEYIKEKDEKLGIEDGIREKVKQIIEDLLNVYDDMKPVYEKIQEEEKNFEEENKFGIESKWYEHKNKNPFKSNTNHYNAFVKMVKKIKEGEPDPTSYFKNKIAEWDKDFITKYHCPLRFQGNYIVDSIKEFKENLKTINGMAKEGNTDKSRIYKGEGFPYNVKKWKGQTTKREFVVFTNVRLDFKDCETLSSDDPFVAICNSFDESLCFSHELVNERNETLCNLEKQ